MKQLIALMIICCFSTALAAQENYSQWKKEASNDIRLLPKYGNAVKTKEQKEADSEFIAACLKQLGSLKAASDAHVKLGFSYFYKGNLKTAMYRFNQAWLLDAKNEEVFWGFGAIYSTFEDFDNALKQYNEGLAINPKSSNLLTDVASIYLMKYQTDGNKNNLTKAIEIFKQSYQLDSANQNTLFKLSVAYFLSNDCSNAKKYYDACKKLGGKPITAEYSAALAEKCKN